MQEGGPRELVYASGTSNLRSDSSTRIKHFAQSELELVLLINSNYNSDGPPLLSRSRE